MDVLEQMTQEEAAFVRLYVKRLELEYSILQSAIDLTDPAGLGLTDFLSAVKLAMQLTAAHLLFQCNLRDCRSIALSEEKKAQIVGFPSPTMEELAELFTRSFFQLLPAPGTPLSQAKKALTGWFSGQPADWANLINKTITEAAPLPVKKGLTGLPSNLAPLTNLIADIFFAGHLFNIHKSGNKKVWPPKSDADNWWLDYDDEFDDPDLNIGSYEDWFDYD